MRLVKIHLTVVKIFRDELTNAELLIVLGHGRRSNFFYHRHKACRAELALSLERGQRLRFLPAQGSSRTPGGEDHGRRVGEELLSLELWTKDSTSAIDLFLDRQTVNMNISSD